jgi:hypothetical protein
MALAAETPVADVADLRERFRGPSTPTPAAAAAAAADMVVMLTESSVDLGKAY